MEDKKEKLLRIQPKKAAIIIQAILGGIAIIAPIVVLITAWTALVAGHPAYPILLAAILVTGIVLLVRCARPRRIGSLYKIGRIAGAGILVLILAITIYLRPFPANDAGIAAAVSTDTVEVIQRWDAWELRPKSKASGVGVVFLPGMLVDPRAHFPLLTPIVEQGGLVVVPTAPLGMPLNGAQMTSQAIASFPDIKTWIVGGHSMGGAMAASIAANNQDIDGLIIWGSNSAMDISQSDIEVLSIYGTKDPFANAKVIDDTRKLLPKDTRYIEIKGGVHAYFGDYTQPGDGEPDIDRGTAERQIIEETVKFVKSFIQD